MRNDYDMVFIPIWNAYSVNKHIQGPAWKHPAMDRARHDGSDIFYARIGVVKHDFSAWKINPLGDCQNSRKFTIPFIIVCCIDDDYGHRLDGKRWKRLNRAVPWTGYAHKRSFIGRNWILVTLLCVFGAISIAPQKNKEKLFKSYLYAHSRSMHYYAFIRFLLGCFLVYSLARTLPSTSKLWRFLSGLCVLFQTFPFAGASCRSKEVVKMRTRVGEKDLLLWLVASDYPISMLQSQCINKHQWNCIQLCVRV